jgi:FMN phosphatase YigB (HAD superfamily)
MKTPILLTDLVGIWILKNDKGYENLLKMFCKEHNLDFKIFYKKREEFLSKYRNLARVGKINYYEFEEKIFKQIDKKNYKKLARKYIKFEIKNCKMFLKVDKNVKNVLRKLKKMGIKIIGITDAIKPNKLKKEELKVLGISKYFDKIYSSHDLKCEKPEAFKHFKNLVDKTVFLGHDDDEILGASKFGFLTIGLKNEKANIMIRSLKQLVEVLQKFRVNFATS